MEKLVNVYIVKVQQVKSMVNVFMISLILEIVITNGPINKENVPNVLKDIVLTPENVKDVKHLDA